MVTSNQKSKEKKKKKSKKPRRQINPPVSGHHTGGQPLAPRHHADGKSLAYGHHVEDKSLTSGHHVEDVPLASARQAGGQGSTIVGPSNNNHHGGEKPTRIGRKPKFPCRLCKGDHFLLDCPGISKVLELWSKSSDQSMSSTSVLGLRNALFMSFINHIFYIFDRSAPIISYSLSPRGYILLFSYVFND